MRDRRVLPGEAGFALAATLLLSLLAGCMPSGPVSPPPERVSLARTPGIDVSHDQGAIDWQQVAGAGNKFVFIKATQGITEVDPDFQSNWSGAGSAGLLRSAYHFYQPGDDPTEQAEHFLSVAPFQASDLPPVLDVEVQGSLSAAQLVHDIGVWLDTVEQATGIAPILYTDPGFWNSLGTQAFGGYPLWVADDQPNGPSLPDGWNGWVFWQYSDAGQVPGISAPVDLSFFQGDFEELQKLTLAPPL